MLTIVDLRLLRTKQVYVFVWEMTMVLLCSPKQLLLQFFTQFMLARLWICTMLWN